MTVVRFILLSGVVILLAVASVLFFQSQFSDEMEGVPLSAWSIFFGLNGFFFAVLIGLLIAQLLGRFHRLNAVVRMEASALGQLTRALKLQTGDDAVEEAIRANVRNYATAVLEVEWPEMASKHRVRGDGGAMGELYSLLFQIRALEMDGDMDLIARRLLVDSAVEVTNLRAERLHLSVEQLSPVIRTVVLFLSLVIVFSFTLVSVGTIGIHVLMVVLLGTAVALLNLGLADLARPLVGVWNVSADPLREVASQATPPVGRSTPQDVA